jgi:hypothetical protein
MKNVVTFWDGGRFRLRHGYGATGRSSGLFVALRVLRVLRETIPSFPWCLSPRSHPIFHQPVSSHVNPCQSPPGGASQPGSPLRSFTGICAYYRLLSPFSWKKKIVYFSGARPWRLSMPPFPPFPSVQESASSGLQTETDQEQTVSRLATFHVGYAR